MNKIKENLEGLIFPIENMKSSKVNVFFLLMCIILISFPLAITSTNLNISGNEQISSILKTTNIEFSRLKIVIIIVNFIITVFNSLIGYFILSCIFQILFILFKKEVYFSKVVYINFYMAFIGLIYAFINTIFSLAFHENQLTIYTNFSFLSKEPILISLLQILDPFILLQFLILFLFLYRICNFKKISSSIFLVIYIITVYFTVYIGNV